MFKSVSDRDRSQSTASLEGKSAGGGTIPGMFKPGMEVPAYRPEDGENKLRFLPPLENDEYAKFCGLGIWLYWVNKRVVISPTSFKSGNDPVLDRYKELKETDPQGKAKVFKPTRRIINYVLDYTHPEEAGVVKVYMTSPTMIKKIIGRATDRKTGKVYPIDDPENGRVVYFHKSGKGLATTYDREDVEWSETDPIKDIDAVVAQMKPFSEILQVATPAEMKQLAAELEEVANNPGGNSEDNFSDMDDKGFQNGQAKRQEDPELEKRLRDKLNATKGSGEAQTAKSDEDIPF